MVPDHKGLAITAPFTSKTRTRLDYFIAAKMLWTGRRDNLSNLIVFKVGSPGFFFAYYSPYTGATGAKESA
jgi:hypothetical protein